MPKNGGWKAYGCAAIAVLLVVLYGCIYQTEFDQNAMYEGLTASTNIAERVIEKLDADVPAELESKICIVGRPGDSAMYHVSNAYDSANEYAQIGHWYMKPGCTRQSWRGLFWYRLGYDIELCEDEVYNRIISRSDVREMPCFPKEGSIQKKDGVIVVKISDTYDYVSNDFT